jgi:hypothetical protein
MNELHTVRRVLFPVSTLISNLVPPSPYRVYLEFLRPASTGTGALSLFPLGLVSSVTSAGWRVGETVTTALNKGGFDRLTYGNLVTDGWSGRNASASFVTEILVIETFRHSKYTLRDAQGHPGVGLSIRRSSLLRKPSQA